MFKFKKFTVNDDQSAMKVGTDGILVGAYTDIGNAYNILDIGTGSGLIALMMAQRSDNSVIDAIEIDHKSAKQARQNAANSPWQERINIKVISLQDFAKTHERTYDLIISNPPFFENSLKSPLEQKNISKHTDLLTYDELLQYASGLMGQYSRFSLIIPFNQSKNLIEKARFAGLHCSKELNIIPRKGKSPNRSILEFRKLKSTILWSELTIRDQEGNYTREYQLLTKEFYLDF